MTRRLIVCVVLCVFALGVSVLLAAVPLAANPTRCLFDPQPGHGKSRCSAKCPPCFQPVCNSNRPCDYTCQPIPGCNP